MPPRIFRRQLLHFVCKHRQSQQSLRRCDVILYAFQVKDLLQVGKIHNTESLEKKSQPCTQLLVLNLLYVVWIEGKERKTVFHLYLFLPYSQNNSYLKLSPKAQLSIISVRKNRNVTELIPDSFKIAQKIIHSTVYFYFVWLRLGD